MNETEKTTFSVPSPGELEQLTELHKAMGDYTRMRILWYLMQKDSCVSELAQKMEVTESAISHQLRGGFWKKPTPIFQKDKNAAPVRSQGLRRVFPYRVS